MNRILRCLAPAFVLACAWPGLRAADDNRPAPKQDVKPNRGAPGKENGPPPAGPGGPRGERRVLLGRPGDGGEKESVTFLGVETAPVTPTLTAQLGLAEGTGLVVVHLVPDGPASGVLKEHDVLLKLDDQLLIEQRQLSVLIRNHKEGDEVTVTYLRAGKQATAKVKLTKHEVPKMVQQFGQPIPGFDGGSSFGPGFGSGNFDVFVPNPNGPQNREIVERVLPLMGGANAPGWRRYTEIGRPDTGPGERNISVTVNTGNSHMVLDDDKGSIDLTIKDGKKELVAKNEKGEAIFSGPVNTPEERKALPLTVRERFERLEDSTQFGFKPSGDFKAQTKIVRPRGQGIAVPAPTPVVKPTPFF